MEQKRADCWAIQVEFRVHSDDQAAKRRAVDGKLPPDLGKKGVYSFYTPHTGQILRQRAQLRPGDAGGGSKGECQFVFRRRPPAEVSIGQGGLNQCLRRTVLRKLFHLTFIDWRLVHSEIDKFCRCAPAIATVPRHFP